MALYAIAELIEARAVGRARNAISGLLAMAPGQASVRQADGSWQSVAVIDVSVDAIVRVRPGERVAMDGVVIEGSSGINQAPVTGESIPVDKGVGDPVFAGTITEGKPRLVSWSVLRPDLDAARIEPIAAALAAHSDPPVSRAIAAGLTPSRIEARNLSALAGRGSQAEVDGALYLLGNHRLIEDRGLCSPALEARLRVHEDAGHTVSLLASQTEALAEIKALSIVPVMLTGDNQATAQAIAHEAGIDDVRGNLLPEDKLAAIQALQLRYGPTAGTDTAREATDVIVMNDDLRRIAETVRLSRRAHHVLWQNITLAPGIKAVFLLVVGNGLRLLRGAQDGAK